MRTLSLAGGDPPGIRGARQAQTMKTIDVALLSSVTGGYTAVTPTGEYWANKGAWLGRQIGPRSEAFGHSVGGIGGDIAYYTTWNPAIIVN